MEFLSDSVLPCFRGLVGWLSAGLRTEVAAAWAQAILGAIAIFASYLIAQKHFDKGNEVQLMRQHEGERQNVVRFKALIISALGTLSSLRDTAIKYPGDKHVPAHACDEMIRCSDTLHRLAMEDLPNSEMINAVFTFADVTKGYAKWIEINKDGVLGDYFIGRINQNIFTCRTLIARLEEYIDEHREDPGAAFDLDFESLIQDDRPL